MPATSVVFFVDEEGACPLLARLHQSELPQSGWPDEWGRLKGGRSHPSFTSDRTRCPTPQGCNLSSRGQGNRRAVGSRVSSGMLKTPHQSRSGW